MAVLILLAFQTLAFADSFKHSLVDFVAFASSQNNVDILISDEVNASSFYFFTESKKPLVSIDMLKNMLASQGLNLMVIILLIILKTIKIFLILSILARVQSFLMSL